MKTKLFRLKHNYQTEKNKLIDTNKQDSQQSQLTKANKMIGCKINDRREFLGKGTRGFMGILRNKKEGKVMLIGKSRTSTRRQWIDYIYSKMGCNFRICIW